MTAGSCGTRAVKRAQQFSRPSDSGKGVYSWDAVVCPLREGRLQTFSAYSREVAKVKPFAVSILGLKPATEIQPQTSNALVQPQFTA